MPTSKLATEQYVHTLGELTGSRPSCCATSTSSGLARTRSRSTPRWSRYSSPPRSRASARRLRRRATVARLHVHRQRRVGQPPRRHGPRVPPNDREHRVRRTVRPAGPARSHRRCCRDVRRSGLRAGASRRCPRLRGGHQRRPRASSATTSWSRSTRGCEGRWSGTPKARRAVHHACDRACRG